MRTVHYSDVLQSSLALAGIPLASIDYTQPEFGLLRTFHDCRLRYAWEAHAWPDVCRYEQRSFAASWNAATAYTAGTVVLDIPTLSYFQALQASTGEAPTINGVTNDPYWAVCQARYEAQPFDATVSYAVGSRVLNVADNQIYQRYVAPGAVLVTNSYFGSSVVVFNLTGNTNNGYPTYLADNGDTILADSNGFWYILNNSGTLCKTVITSAPTPDQAPTWHSIDPRVSPPVVTSVDGSTPPAGGWGLLTPFIRNVAYQQYDVNGNALTPIGEVLAAFDRDPRLGTKVCKLPFRVTSDGFDFYALRHTLAFVWLCYRLQKPVLSGSLFSATQVYASGQQVYFVDPVQGTGDFWNCTATTTAGQSPATTPAKWAVVALPYVFSEYLSQGGYADWLTSDGQLDKAGAIEREAENLLEMELDKLQRQQQQVNRLDWRS